MNPSHYRELEVWQLSMELAKHVYTLSADFPSAERYGLTSQMQRAAVSIPSNIAEGNARHSTREYARFAAIAKGSAAELQTQLLLVESLGIGNETSFQEALELCERTSMMLCRLHQALMRKLRAPGTRVPGPGSRSSDPRYQGPSRGSEDA